MERTKKERSLSHVNFLSRSLHASQAAAHVRITLGVFGYYLLIIYLEREEEVPPENPGISLLGLAASS